MNVFANSDNSLTEDELKSMFRDVVSGDFEIIEEARGYPLTAGYSKNIRADFLIYPKQELIAMGASAEWFAIEAKAESKENFRFPHSAIAQCADYVNSSFRLPGSMATVKPIMGFVLSPTTMLWDASTKSYYQGAMRQAQKFGVGGVYMPAAFGVSVDKWGASGYGFYVLEPGSGCFLIRRTLRGLIVAGNDPAGARKIGNRGK